MSSSAKEALCAGTPLPVLIFKTWWTGTKGLGSESPRDCVSAMKIMSFPFLHRPLLSPSPSPTHTPRSATASRVF